MIIVKFCINMKYFSEIHLITNNNEIDNAGYDFFFETAASQYLTFYDTYLKNSKHSSVFFSVT